MTMNVSSNPRNCPIRLYHHPSLPPFPFPVGIPSSREAGYLSLERPTFESLVCLNVESKNTQVGFGTTRPGFSDQPPSLPDPCPRSEPSLRAYHWSRGPTCEFSCLELPIGVVGLSSRHGPVTFYHLPPTTRLILPACTTQALTVEHCPANSYSSSRTQFRQIFHEAVPGSSP